MKFDFKKFCEESGISEKKVVSVLGINAYTDLSRIKTLNGYLEALSLISDEKRNADEEFVKLNELIEAEAKGTIQGYKKVFDLYAYRTDQLFNEYPISIALWQFIQTEYAQIQTLSALLSLHESISAMLTEEHENLIREKLISLVSSKEEAQSLFEGVFESHMEDVHVDKLIEKWAGFYGYKKDS